ncbi:hypothetical protein EP331_15180 [bacterium]|nr:MAG: hypothetical protein EP331_15180 [bacterium]
MDADVMYLNINDSLFINTTYVKGSGVDDYLYGTAKIYEDPSYGLADGIFLHRLTMYRLNKDTVIVKPILIGETKLIREYVSFNFISDRKTVTTTYIVISK